MAREDRLRRSFEAAAEYFPNPVDLPAVWRWDDFANLRLFALVDVPLRQLPTGFFDRQSSFGCRQEYQGYGVDDCGLAVLLSGNQLGLGGPPGWVEGIRLGHVVELQP